MDEEKQYTLEEYKDSENFEAEYNYRRKRVPGRDEEVLTENLTEKNVRPVENFVRNLQCS